MAGNPTIDRKWNIPASAYRGAGVATPLMSGHSASVTSNTNSGNHMSHVTPLKPTSCTGEQSDSFLLVLPPRDEDGQPRLGL
jgi:hypothetical protein